MFTSMQKIISLFEDKSVPRGEYIFREGDLDLCFYIVTSGKIEIQQKTHTGEIKSIALVKSGDFLGEGALSQNTANHIRPASALALENTNLLVLSRAKFYEFLKKDPETALDFVFQILEVTYTRLKFANAELVALYEVGRLIGLYLDDLTTLARKILDQLREVTNSSSALMVIKDHLTNQKEIIGKVGEFDGVKMGELGALSSSIVNDLADVKKYGLEKQKILLAQMGNSGFILLAREQDERDYNEGHLKLLESIAGQSSFAIERARKMRDDKAKAMYEQRKRQFTF